MSSNLSKFNEQLLNFLAEMCKLCPDDKTLSNFYYSVDLLKKANPREIMNQFKQYIFPFKNQILSKDELFFINNTFTDSIKSNQGISELTRIKQIWVSGILTSHDKECIWNYFKVFIYLIEKEYPSK